MKKVLVTGSTGFIGTHLVQKLIGNPKLEVIGVTRNNSSITSSETLSYIYYDLSLSNNFNEKLIGIHTVIHLAGVAHGKGVSENELNKVNVEATRDLVLSSINAGVKRFIFISSIGVNGVATPNARQFYFDDQPNPDNLYSKSKLLAENVLKDAVGAGGIGMDYFILRPPMVYGKNAPGNFKKLKNLIKQKVIMPFGSLTQKRSFISVDNLTDIIIECIDYKCKANEILLVSDGHNISVRDFIALIGSKLGINCRFINIPVELILLISKLTNKKEKIQGLIYPMQINIDRTKEILSWTPALSLEEGINKAVNE